MALKHEFYLQLTEVINRHGVDTYLNKYDFAIAEFIGSVINNLKDMQLLQNQLKQNIHTDTEENTVK